MPFAKARAANRCLLAAAIATLCSGAADAATVMIWPIDPVIEAGDTSGALWLENHGQSDVVLQVRVLGWTQEGGIDIHSEQEEIVASPPVVRVPPRGRQLIRLVSTDTKRDPGEAAFRVLIDELPAVMADKDRKRTETGIHFQMRYSVPLFVNGGQVQKRMIAAKADAASRLSCAVSPDRTSVIIANEGAVHARLTNLAVVTGDESKALGLGRLGYILAGSAMSWRLPNTLNGQVRVSGQLEGREGRVSLGPCSTQ